MNYKKIYEEIIRKRVKNPPSGFFERHHILPRSLGGDDSPENIVKLTPREHFVCHQLLAKIYGGPMHTALFFMSHPKTTSGRGMILTARRYEHARKLFSSRMSRMIKGSKNPNYGKKHSPRVRAIISETKSRYKMTDHPRAINEKTEWVNKNGEMFYGSHFDLAKFTGLPHGNLRKVSNGSIFSYKGWMCPSSGRENMREGENTNTADKKEYTWISPDGERIKGTRAFIRRTKGLTQSGASSLVLGTIKTHKGWSICKK